jgi:hypothetical protein
MVLSGADQRIVVLRNGIEIGRARIALLDADTPLGTHAFIVKSGEGSGRSVLLEGAAARIWMEVPMPGYAGTTSGALAAVVGGRMHLPQDFARQLYPLLVPGTTLLVTDAPVLEQNSGRQLTVLGGGNPL